MSNRHLSILLLGLLLGGMVLAAGVLVVGPKSVEDQTVNLYEANQELLAEQGAVRLWETVRDVEVRLATSVSHQWAWLEEAKTKDDLQFALARLSHHTDPTFGISLAVLDANGEALAVEPDAKPERIEALESHAHRIDALSPAISAVTCQRCLNEQDSLLIATEIDHGRVLAASIDLRRLAERLFEHISRSRSTYFALLDNNDNVIFASGDGEERSEDEWVIGTAAVPDTDLRLEIGAPRAAIAPEVHARVRTLLYTTYGVLIFLLACIGVLGLLKRREQRENLAKVRSMAHQDKLATLGLMAASTAHEIRNAIAVASLQLQVAASVEDPDETADHIEKATASVDRLADLAESLSRYAGKGQADDERFEVSEAIAEAMGVVQPRVREHFSVEVDSETGLYIRGSRAALVQVLVNLVLNALDELEGRGDGGQVQVQAHTEAGEVVISVVDNGSGIAPDVLDNVFEPFFSTKDDQAASGGTGIGLWLCAQIVDQHNGTIDAENNDGGGARFVVRIPMADQRESSGEFEVAGGDVSSDDESGSSRESA